MILAFAVAGLAYSLTAQDGNAPQSNGPAAQQDGPGNPGYGLDDRGWDELIIKHLPNARLARQGMILRV